MKAILQNLAADAIDHEATTEHIPFLSRSNSGQFQTVVSKIQLRTLLLFFTS
jgi:hypothetical protein